jgi:hypothetical protein
MVVSKVHFKACRQQATARLLILGFYKQNWIWGLNGENWIFR